VRFWDSSSLVPLIIGEAQSILCRGLIESDDGVLVWSFSIVEITSALCRRRREGLLSAEDFRSAKKNLEDLWRGSNEITQHEVIKRRSLRLLETHALRAADSLQLAAALIACEEEPDGFPFVSFDDRLADAAEKEGFDVIRNR